MALTTSGIQQCMEICNDITSQISKLSEIRAVSDFMNSNDDFSKFISGTTFGTQSYEKWGALLNLIASDLSQAMTNLNSATSSYLEKQGEYNSKSISIGRPGNQPISGTPGPSLNPIGGNDKIYVTPKFQSGQYPDITTPGFGPKTGVERW